MSIKKLSKDVIAYVCAGVHIVDQAHAIEETIQNSKHFRRVIFRINYLFNVKVSIRVRDNLICWLGLEAGATTIEVR